MNYHSAANWIRITAPTNDETTRLGIAGKRIIYQHTADNGTVKVYLFDGIEYKGPYYISPESLRQDE